MCGRYYRRSDKQRIAEAFHLGQLPDNFVMPPWDYNVAPTTHQAVIRHNKQTAERELVLMRWGMVPHFAKSLSDFKGMATINAKAETLMSTAMWRVPFQRRRCLIPADGFYEWKKLDGKTGSLMPSQCRTAARSRSLVCGMRGKIPLGTVGFRASRS
jgi:putative SOS response-associated peptidase YedK